RKLTSLPASNLDLAQRGLLKEGYFADVVVFDPKTIIDHATYEKPHQYATGVRHGFVNGVQVLKDGEHTGAKPGGALWGPGKTRESAEEQRMMEARRPAFLDRFFDVRGRGSTVRTEVLGGVTTFVAMAYIIVVNPAILAVAGIPIGPST